MTFNEIMHKYLTDNGMFDGQRMAVMELVAAHDGFETLIAIMGQESSHYPQNITKLCLYTLNTVALEYIDENCPSAWFRLNFLTHSEREVILNGDKERNKSAGHTFAVAYGQNADGEQLQP